MPEAVPARGDILDWLRQTIPALARQAAWGGDCRDASRFPGSVCHMYN